MTQQFDTTFLRAMQLLQSPEKDATDQLKAMLDESLAQKKVPMNSAGSTVKPYVPPSIPSGAFVRPYKPSSKQPIKPPPKPVASKCSAPLHTPIIVPSDDIDPSSSKCQVCQQSDTKAGNEIVECQECHNLYHQECHKPSLENENVKDPRFVWYCSTCTSKRKKVKLPLNKAATLTGNGSTSKDTKEHQNPEVSPFKSWSFLKK